MNPQLFDFLINMLYKRAKDAEKKISFENLSIQKRVAIKTSILLNIVQEFVI